MSNPFGTSLRRDPGDPRGLLDRIDAAVRERIEEAVEFGCMELLVQLRRARGRPAPEATSATDRKEFESLVRELLLHLRGALLEGLPAEHAEKLAQTEAAQGQDQVPRLLAGQAALARGLPDYWERFEALTRAFVQTRLGAPAARGLLDHLFRRT